MRVLIAGGGVFGLSAAAELARRGHRVEVREAGGIPSDRAASRDISKAIRGSYGPACALYAPAALRAREAWRALERASGRAILHEVGGLHLTTRCDPAGFEAASCAWLRDHGWPVRELGLREAGEILPWFRMDGVAEAFLDPWAGWLDPMAALPALSGLAAARGAVVRAEARMDDLAEGLREADAVLGCAGAWLKPLLEGLGFPVRLTRQHVACFRPAEPAPFRTARPAPFWSFDLAGAGWYGFPLHPDGIVKLACHLPDADASADDPRAPDPAQAARARAFVRERIPALAAALDEGRTCLYALSPDGHFLFDAVPGCPGLFVAGCGSGHAFKFGPVLGEWAADLVEGRPVPPEFRIGARARSRVV